jgi:hypothetical protein
MRYAFQHAAVRDLRRAARRRAWRDARLYALATGLIVTLLAVWGSLP